MRYLCRHTLRVLGIYLPIYLETLVNEIRQTAPDTGFLYSNPKCLKFALKSILGQDHFVPYAGLAINLLKPMFLVTVL